jgi:hypothetical protein
MQRLSISKFVPKLPAAYTILSLIAPCFSSFDEKTLKIDLTENPGTDKTVNLTVGSSNLLYKTVPSDVPKNMPRSSSYHTTHWKRPPRALN